MEWVLVCNPDVPESEENPGLVTRESFELNMKQNGWRLHTDAHAAKKTKEK